MPDIGRLGSVELLLGTFAQVLSLGKLRSKISVCELSLHNFGLQAMLVGTGGCAALGNVCLRIFYVNFSWEHSLGNIPMGRPFWSSLLATSA